jgi:3-hydroxyisobutyrate dehydrogenase
MTSTDRRPRVGFLGLGRMGALMARHVLAAGYDLTVWNRTAAKAEPLRAAGAAVATSPAEAAAGREVVVLMLADPPSVHDVLFGPRGVVTGAAPGTLVIDAATIGPQAARDNAARLAGHGLRYVDAPVFGSVGPAAEGTLGVLAGGDDADLAEAGPLLRLWGDPAKVQHVGPVGTGSAAKLVRILGLGLVLAGIGDAIRLGAALGLPAPLVQDLVAAGPLGGMFAGVRPFLDGADPEPAGFSLAMLTKDLGLCAAAAGDLAITDAARTAGEAAVAAGYGEADCQAWPALRDGGKI